MYALRPRSIRSVAEEVGICCIAMRNILKEREIDIWPKNKLASPNLKEDYFDLIDTEEKAYFLGPLMTDGNVFEQEKRSKMISLTLKKEDAYMVQAFRDAVGS